MLYGSRVAQLDAQMLDRELSSIFAGRVVGALEHAIPDVGRRFKHEIRAALDMAIFGSTVLRNRPTPGMRLNHLMFSEATSVSRVSRRKRVAYVLGSILIRWSWSKLLDRSANEMWSEAPRGSWQRYVATIIRRTETFVSVFTLANMIFFLRYGTFRSVFERILGIRMVPVDERAQNPMQFSNQNMQLLSTALTEMMFFVVPLVNWGQLRRFAMLVARFVARWGRRLFLLVLARVTGRTEEIKDADSRRRRRREDIRTARCAACDVGTVCMPYRASCGHVYCYTCICSIAAAADEDERPLRCVRCNEVIDRTSRIARE